MNVFGDMIVGRKAIIEFLRVPLQLYEDETVAWRKINRWKQKYYLTRLIHHTPSGAPYIIPAEIRAWLDMFDERCQAIAMGTNFGRRHVDRRQEKGR